MEHLDNFTLRIIQVEWKQILQLANTDQCDDTCPAKSYLIQYNLTCQPCQSKCLTCENGYQCLTCQPNFFYDATDKSCNALCLKTLKWGNSSSQTCQAHCSNDFYNYQQNICGGQNGNAEPNNLRGLTAYLSEVKQQSSLTQTYQYNLVFDRNVLLAAPLLMYRSCINIHILGYENTTAFSIKLQKATPSSFLITLQPNLQYGISQLDLFVNFTNQTCLLDQFDIPLSNSLFENGVTLKVKSNIIKYDEAVIETTKVISSTSEAASQTTSTLAMPLFLSNVMFVFWLLINVFQLLSLFLYIDVKYPVNILNFFKSFSSFNFSFLPTMGLTSTTEKDVTTMQFLGFRITDQETPTVFYTRGMESSSFFINGFKFLQTIIILHLIIQAIQALKRFFSVNPYDASEEDGIFVKIFNFVYNKLVYTMLITSHQGFILNISFAFILQFINFNNNTFINVVGNLLALVLVIYILSFMLWIYQKINHRQLLPLLIGTKIGSKISSQVNNLVYLKFKSRFEVIYWNLDYIYFFRRNYHLLSIIKNFLVPMIIVYFYKYPVLVILLLQLIYLSFSGYLFFYRPFEKKIICILAGINDMFIFVVLVLILTIHYVTGDQSQFKIEFSAIKASLEIGWVIITMLLILFLLNLVFSVAIEWDTIREFCKSLQQRFKKSSTQEEKNELIISDRKSVTGQQLYQVPQKIIEL